MSLSLRRLALVLLLATSLVQNLSVAAAAAGARDINAALYDEMVAKYLPLERWLQQKDLNSCLSDTRADVLFAVDGSESVSMTDFHLVVKSILVDTISRLEIGENFVQVGVLVFSDQVYQVLPIGKYASKVDLLRTVSQLTYEGGYTAIDAAIEGCIAELSRRQADAANATVGAELAERRRVVVFVTDGRHTGSFGVFMRDLLGQLHRRVTAVMALGLQNSDQSMLLQLATDPALVFDPTAYPEYLASLHSLLNMRCSGTCFQYENQEANVRKVIGTLVQYVNYLIGNFASYRRQESALVEYARSINESVVSLEEDIERSCNAEDNGLLRRIVTLQDRIRTETNGSNFAGASIDAYVGEMIRKINTVQKQVFDQSQTLATEKTKLAGTGLEEERLRADYQARLESKIAVRKAQAESLAALETRIATYQKEMVSVTQSIARFENVSIELSTRLRTQESVYTSRLAQLTALSQENTVLSAVQTGGQNHLAGMRDKLALCQAHNRDGYTVLFAISCRSGANFESLFSREDSSFSAGAFNGLSVQHPVYKSPYLRQLHTMGYFSSVTWQFLDTKGLLIGSVTMDTSKSQLSSLFSRARVAASYPWVASYVNSIYSASLDQFRPKSDAEFLLVFGDLAHYRATGSCADIAGVFIVLAAPHRCFPDSAGAALPQVYVSNSPFGGRINLPVAQLRLVTGRLPGAADRPTSPTRTTNSEQLTEILLYVKSGAGYLHSLLLTSRFTQAALLADVDDLSQLARHYKSSMLAGLNLENYRAIRMELFDQAGRVLAALRFRGPWFNETAGSRRGTPGEIGADRLGNWAWFQARYLVSAEPFNLQRLGTSGFSFYNGVEFFVIGDRLTAEDCEERRYFLTVVDGATTCQCFSGPADAAAAATPGIYFANAAAPQSCDRLTRAEGLRLTGELLRPGAAAAAAA